MEYTKSKARVSRWQEEVLLLVEEMRRSIAFLQWKAQWWRSLAAKRRVRNEIRSGLVAYNRRQEAQLLALAEKFAVLWRPTLKDGLFDVSWVDGFLSQRQQ